MITSFLLQSQPIKKNHFIAGTGISFRGNNEQYQEGFAYKLKLNLSLEYNFLERTSVGIKGGVDQNKVISGNSISTFYTGPFIRQYIFHGLNAQLAYLIRKDKAHLLQVIAGYSFYIGNHLIVEPYLEYGKEVIKEVNGDHLAFGLGFRFIL